MPKPWEKYGQPWLSYRQLQNEQTGIAQHIPMSDFEEPPSDPELSDRVQRVKTLGAQGMVESPISEATGLVDASVAGLRGIYDTLMPGGLSGPEAVERQAGKLQYDPRTEGGRIAEQGNQAIGEAYSDVADKFATATGTDETAFGNTLMYTGAMAIPLVLGRRRGTSKGKGVDPAPTIEKLNADIRAAYERADEAGVAVSGQSFGEFVDRLLTKMTDEAITPTNHPKAFAVLDDLIGKAGNNHTLKGLEQIRRTMLDAGRSGDKVDARLAHIMRKEFDDYLDGLQSVDVLTGNPKIGVSALQEGRALSRRRMQAEEIGELIRRAEQKAGGYTGSGFENALRAEFRRVATKKEWLQMFDPEVRKAILDVVSGGQLARDIGRLAPKSGLNAAAGSGVGMAIGSTVAGPMGGTIGLLAPPIAGAIARGAATKRTTRAAMMAEELARRGGTGKPVDPRLGLTAETLQNR